MRPYPLIVIAAVTALAICRFGLSEDGSAPNTKKDEADPPEAKIELTPREQKFKESMTKVRMVGYYTMDGQKLDKGLPEDSYTIFSVDKVGPDLWRFVVIIHFGKMKLPIPVTVPIKWAGDTPVISVTDLKIAMFPPYSARIVLYRGQYAGTWHGKGYGGKIFGRIEKIKQEVEETPASPQPKAEPKETKPEPEADAGK